MAYKKASDEEQQEAANIINKLRSDLDMKMTDIANMSGIHRTTLSRIVSAVEKNDQDYRTSTSTVRKLREVHERMYAPGAQAREKSPKDMRRAAGSGVWGGLNIAKQLATDLREQLEHTLEQHAHPLVAPGIKELADRAREIEKTLAVTKDDMKDEDNGTE